MVGNEIDRPHVVRPVSQFNEQNTDILAHRQQQFAKVFRLFVIRLHFKTGEFRHAIDKAGDFGTKFAPDLIKRDIRILDHIMQQCRDDRGFVEMHVSKDLRHLKRVGEVGITRRSNLTVMRPFR